jgi:hypothetical protein
MPTDPRDVSAASIQKPCGPLCGDTICFECVVPASPAALRRESPKQALGRVAEETRKMIERYPFLRWRSSASNGR